MQHTACVDARIAAPVRQALSVVDGIVNLPLLNILIGAPVQVLGLLTVRPAPVPLSAPLCSALRPASQLSTPASGCAHVTRCVLLWRCAQAVALGLRYVKEGKSWEKDFKNAHAKARRVLRCVLCSSEHCASAEVPLARSLMSEDESD